MFKIRLYLSILDENIDHLNFFFLVLPNTNSSFFSNCYLNKKPLVKAVWVILYREKVKQNAMFGWKKKGELFLRETHIAKK